MPPVTVPFVDTNPSLESCWRAIILLGKNTACYKFALAQALLEVNRQNTKIHLEAIAPPTPTHNPNHLKSHPKQITRNSSTFLSNCKQFNNGEITETKLTEQTMRYGFVNVLDAFHNVAGSTTEKFFFDKQNWNKEKRITLTDEFYHLMKSNQKINFAEEINSRWALWETAISLNVPTNVLVGNEVHNDEHSLTVSQGNFRRKNVTSTKTALNGYQKGKCFYCSSNLVLVSKSPNMNCHVDHFVPWKLSDQFKPHNIDLNGIWNLVLACSECNGAGEKWHQLPSLTYLEKLYIRNNFYVESHHPLKQTILNQKGNEHHFLQKVWDVARNTGTPIWKPHENQQSIGL